jgi:hypothetical protein
MQQPSGVDRARRRTDDLDAATDRSGRSASGPRRFQDGALQMLTIRRRRSLNGILASLALAGVLALPGSVSADHLEGTEMLAPDLAPGESVLHEQYLGLGKSGIPNVVYDGNPTFVDGERVTATILEVVIQGDAPSTAQGTAELLSTSTLTATVPADWSTNEFAWIRFDERIDVRYTAPSATALLEAGCDSKLYVRVGLLIDIVGDAGTHATIDPVSELPLVLVSVPTIHCPAAVLATPPATDLLAPAPVTPDHPAGTMGLLAMLSALASTVIMTRGRWRAGWDSNPRPKD